MSLGLSLRGALLVDERLYPDHEVDEKIKYIRDLIEKIEDPSKKLLAIEALNHVFKVRDELHLDNLDIMNGLARVELLVNKILNAQ